MAALLAPPKVRPLAEWSSSRYPGPNAEERGYRLEVTISVEEPREEAPVALPRIDPPSAPAPPIATPATLPPAAPRPDAQGLYDLRQLLGRIWSIPDTTTSSPAAASPARPDPAPLRESSPPSPPEDDDRLERAGPSDFALLSVIPISEDRQEDAPELRPLPPPPAPELPRWNPVTASRGTVTRHRAQAWICVSCRLINAPWSVLCTRCRTAAPSN